MKKRTKREKVCSKQFLFCISWHHKKSIITEVVEFFWFDSYTETIGKDSHEGDGEENAVSRTMYKLCCLASKAINNPENEENGDIAKQTKVAEDFLYESTFHRR